MAPSEQSSTSRTIVLIHGLWLTPRSWEHWKERYEARGHQVIAPAWPGMEPEVEALRAEPAALTQLDFKKVADNYERIIRDLPSPPIIMGHSIGGTLTQVLLDRGLGSAGVGIAPAAVKGLYGLALSTIKASRPVLGNPLNRSKATPLTQTQFHYAFGNTMSRSESDAVYDRYAVPAANRVLFDVALANFSRKSAVAVDFERSGRAPLLMIGFDQDHVVPPKGIRANSEKYKTGTVAYTSFPNRPHFPGAPGWEDVADYALQWAEEHARSGSKAAVSTS